MTPTQQLVDQLGGLIKTAELHRIGLGRDEIADAVKRGEIERVRQAWYANPWLPVEQKHAARVGGQLACASATSALGLWEPMHSSLHLCVKPTDARLRTPTSRRTRLTDQHPGVIVHWSGNDPAGTRTVVSPLTCVRQVADCLSVELALAVAESGLHRGAFTRSEWRATLKALPSRVRAELSKATTLSETGSESIFVYRMSLIGILVRQQVSIPGVGRVDGLIGDRLIIEIDSRAFHCDPAADRHRDALLSALGYRVLRFMYSQVMDHWPEVLAAVLAAIRRGDHLAQAA
jgi:very-short-patch-repair endonuclease